MSAEPENYDPLVALLKSKQTPPTPTAFFDRLSDRIRDGIEHAPPPPNRTWWQRFAADIDLKACVAGVCVCALMLLGLLLAINADTPPRPPVPVAFTPEPFSAPTVPDPRLLPASTEPVLQLTSSNAPFAPFRLPPPVPVNYWEAPAPSTH